jgi:ubiquinone/menaquinone biosynthesis C-methylase UbiE
LGLGLFEKSARYYDVIYDAMGKDYGREAKRLRELIRKHQKSTGKTLLDVACGTGRHISFLKQSFEVEGLDLDRKLLAIARRRNPDIMFHYGNMLNFKLYTQFDVITCLFSAIGYMTSYRKLQQAIGNMEHHLRPGGVLIIEPWITPTAYIPGHVGAVFVNQPKLKIARMNRALIKGCISILDFHYLVATPGSIKYFMEHDEFGLFTHRQYVTAFHAAGLKVVRDSKGLIGRGLYIGTKSL